MVKTLVMTYNHVSGYPAGTYKRNGNEVIVCSGQGYADERAPQVFRDIIEQAKDVDTIDKAYIYAGIRAAGQTQLTTAVLRTVSDVTLVACDCSAYEKSAFAKSLNVPLRWSECGGDRTLGDIVDKLLEGYEKVA